MLQLARGKEDRARAIQFSCDGHVERGLTADAQAVRAKPGDFRWRETLPQR